MTINKEETIQLCKAYQKYGTLKEVSRIFARSPNTVKKYVSLKMAVKTQNIVKSLCSNNKRLIGVYVGIWMGDGTQYYKNRYTIKICSNKDDKHLNDFIQHIIYLLFRKKTTLIEESLTKRACIIFWSKFIFNFIYTYVVHGEGKKTYYVQLKEKIESYNRDFLEGCLLGLVLTDGYLKSKFHFNVTSSNLAENMKDILIKFAFNPSVYIHKREKYGWKNLYMVKLNTEESKRLGSFLDQILRKIGYSLSFQELKYGPGRI